MISPSLFEQSTFSMLAISVLFPRYTTVQEAMHVQRKHNKWSSNVQVIKI